MTIDNMNAEDPGSGLSRINQGRKGNIILFGEMLADVFPDRTVLGGAPFNVARHLKAFGQNPILITRLGSDELRDKMMQVMTEREMDTIGIQCDKSHPTGQVQVRIENGEPRFEILPNQAYDFIHPSVVRMTTLSIDPVLVYFGTLAQRNDVSARALKTLLRSTSAAKFLDVNLRAPWYEESTIRHSLQCADLVKINDKELEELAKMLGITENSAHEQAHQLAVRFDIEQIIVTCGGEGSWLVNRDGSKVVAEIKSKLDSIVDTVGAGDGFASVCILGTMLGWPMGMTMERANAFAAAICGIRGAIPDRDDFYHIFLSGWGI